VSETDTGFGARFNVIAAFAEEQDGFAALNSLTRSGVPPSAITVHRPEDGPACAEVIELEAEMGDEIGDGWGLLSGAQATGAFITALTLGMAGIALGFVAGMAWAYLFVSDFSRPGRILLATAVIGLAGATVGLVVGGAGLVRQQDAGRDWGEGPEMAERDVLVTVHLADADAAARAARLLRWLGAERVHFIDVNGVALPRQAQHPRPADPEGWWWGHAGHG
jgi:hypothetical protein